MAKKLEQTSGHNECCSVPSPRLITSVQKKRYLFNQAIEYVHTVRMLDFRSDFTPLCTLEKTMLT